jgi:hypothetical protein
MIVVLSLIAGFWLGAWHRTRPLVKAISRWSAAGGRIVVQHGRRAATRLSPVHHLSRLSRQANRVRMGLAVLMPRPVRLWMCTRCLEAEDNPDVWCTEFKSRVCQHLDISAHAPLTRIAEQLILANPHAEPARMRALAHSLDGAIYGGAPLDFPAWKREFMQQMRPRPLHRNRTRSRRARATLPALNPRVA